MNILYSQYHQYTITQPVFVIACQIARVHLPTITDFTYNIKSKKQANIMVAPYGFEPLCSDYAVHYYSHLNFALNEKKERKMINETLPEFISFNNTF